MSRTPFGPLSDGLEGTRDAPGGSVAKVAMTRVDTAALRALYEAREQAGRNARSGFSPFTVEQVAGLHARQEKEHNTNGAFDEAVTRDLPALLDELDSLREVARAARESIRAATHDADDREVLWKGGEPVSISRLRAALAKVRT